MAAAFEIRIYTIAVGDPTTAGEEALDTDTLNRVSELTGGRAFEALDQQELQRAYEAIADLEPNLYETVSYRPRQSLHWLPIGVALVLYVLYHAVGTWRTLRNPVKPRVA